MIDSIQTIADTPSLLPFRANPTDAGADLKAGHRFALHPGERRTVGTGVRVRIPQGFVGLICGRSGLAAKFGVDVLGGVIDSGYQGEIKVVLLNTGRRGELVVPEGERIAQLLIIPIATPTFEPVDSFDEATLRGAAGFGSTGQ